MRRIILAALAMILIALVWACSSKTTTQKAVAPVAVHDTSRPMVISTSPADGDSNVAMDAPITVHFSEEMDPATINQDCFFINGGFTGAIDYDDMTAVFTPTEPLDSGARYYTVVHLEVADTAGNHMADNYHWWFYTIGYPDTTTPPDTIIPDPLHLEIVTVDPPDGAVGVSFNTPFTVTFSEKVDPNTVKDSTFFLSNSMPGKITVSRNTATLTPSGPLGGNRTYTVTLTKAVADSRGHHLADDYSWSVTTEPVEIMPLAVGNSWTYHTVAVDSLGNVTTDRYETMSIIATETIAEETWFTTNGNSRYINRPNGLSVWCNASNVFMAKFPTFPGESFNTGVWQSYCAPSSFQTVSTDVVITVPAGTFRCIEYYADRGTDLYYYFYSPNVGLVKYVYVFRQNQSNTMSRVLTKVDLQ